jgi:UPF0176 protein
VTTTSFFSTGSSNGNINNHHKSTYTSISFFHFVPLPEKELDSIVSRATETLSAFDVKGTLLIAPEGYNGQFAIESTRLERFSNCLANIDDKLGSVELNIGKTFSYGGSEFPFKKLLVKRRKFILTDNYNLPLNLQDHYGREAHAEEWHSLVSSEDAVVIDCRNDYESDLGKFEGAIPLNTKIFSESWVGIASHHIT